MARFTRTWWGQRFIAALEQFTDAGRLGRGRSYANNGRILSYTIERGTVAAKVRGSINPYFGVYKEPTYTTKVSLAPIGRAEWTKLVADMSSQAGYITRLLLGEVPETIERVFSARGLSLLPTGRKDFTTSCSCPDWGDPCKHVAGLCYLLAGVLDRDPFLLFELRGLSRQELRDELSRSPLGQILAAELTAAEAPPSLPPARFTRPTREPSPATTLKEFWTGARRPPAVSESPPSSVPALLIKKEGDYPAFWSKDASFLETMEDLYERVRSKGLKK